VTRVRNAAIHVRTWAAAEAGKWNGLENDRSNTARALQQKGGVNGLERQLKECFVQMANDAIAKLTRNILARFAPLLSESSAALEALSPAEGDWEESLGLSLEQALDQDARRDVFVAYSQSGGDLGCCSMVCRGWREAQCTLRKEWVHRHSSAEVDPWSLRPALAMEWKRLESMDGGAQQESVKHTWDLAGMCIKLWGAKLFRENLGSWRHE